MVLVDSVRNDLLARMTLQGHKGIPVSSEQSWFVMARLTNEILSQDECVDLDIANGLFFTFSAVA